LCQAFIKFLRKFDQKGTSFSLLPWRGEVRKSDTRSLQFVSDSRELISEKVNFLRAHKRTPVMKYELDKGKYSRGNRSFWCGKKGRSV